MPGVLMLVSARSQGLWTGLLASAGRQGRARGSARLLCLGFGPSLPFGCCSGSRASCLGHSTALLWHRLCCWAWVWPALCLGFSPATAGASATIGAGPLVRPQVPLAERPRGHGSKPALGGECCGLEGLGGQGSPRQLHGLGQGAPQPSEAEACPPGSAPAPTWLPTLAPRRRLRQPPGDSPVLFSESSSDSQQECGSPARWGPALPFRVAPAAHPSPPQVIEKGVLCSRHLDALQRVAVT